MKLYVQERVFGEAIQSLGQNPGKAEHMRRD